MPYGARRLALKDPPGDGPQGANLGGIPGVHPWFKAAPHLRPPKNIGSRLPVHGRKPGVTPKVVHKYIT